MPAAGYRPFSRPQETQRVSRTNHCLKVFVFWSFEIFVLNCRSNYRTFSVFVWLCIQFQAVEIISSSEREAFHCSSSCAFRGSATSAGGSPGRRATTRRGTLFPV